MVKRPIRRVEIADIAMGVKKSAAPSMVTPPTNSVANQIKPPLTSKEPIPTVKTMKGSRIRERMGHKSAFKIPTIAAAIKAVSHEFRDNPTDI
jgi:hypothetical protein